MVHDAAESRRQGIVARYGQVETVSDQTGEPARTRSGIAADVCEAEQIAVASRDPTGHADRPRVHRLANLGGADPWNKIEEARLSVTWRSGFGDKGTLILIPTTRINGENGASTGDSVTYGLYAAATWRINKDLTIGPGIGVFSRLEDGSRVFPFLAIEWDITERWNLSTSRGLAASQGPGLTLSYELNEDWSLGLSGRYEDIEFRLDDDGPAADGVGRDQSLPVVFMATLDPSPRFSLSVFAGIEFGGTLTLKDSRGEVLDKSSYDPATLFGATIEARF